MSLDNLCPVLLKVLEDDNTILGLSDHFTNGPPGMTLQDSKLEGTNKTAIWIRRPNKNESPYIGGGYLFDLLIQVDVLSKASYDAAFDLGTLVEDLLKSTTSKLYNNTTYPINLLLQSRPGTLWDDQLQRWHEVVRFRADGSY